jgi:ABC-2 type transport system permease protein
LRGAVTYTALTQASIAFLSLFSWYDVMHSVYTGAVASDLLKPMNFFGFWLAQDLGRALASLLTRGLTILVVYALVFDIILPSSLGQWFALGAALGLSWLISFAWRFLVNLAAFWTPNAIGVGRLAFSLTWFMSGFLMPLRFFPERVVQIIYLTPFPHMVNAFVEAYLGLTTGPALLRLLLAQLLWAVILIGVGQWVLRAGVRRLVIQGG